MITPQPHTADIPSWLHDQELGTYKLKIITTKLPSCHNNSLQGLGLQVSDKTFVNYTQSKSLLETHNPYNTFMDALIRFSYRAMQHLFSVTMQNLPLQHYSSQGLVLADSILGEKQSNVLTSVHKIFD